jgi:hypothetical protein
MRKLLIISITILFSTVGCNYLDIVPDNVATIDNAFTMRSSAEKFLFTCYRYMPDHASLANNPAWAGGDEFWFAYPLVGVSAPGWNIARGNQNVSSPYVNYWDGVSRLYVGIRDCNIFLENIMKVPDMQEMEKLRWIAEVKFLKAYYHFWLLRMYGPIPLIRENLPVYAGVDEVKVYREPVDDCIDYIVELIDETVPYLPDEITNTLTELGRITKPVALAVKAKVLVTGASPQFNGNTDYKGFTDNRGISLVNTEFQISKWERAAEACEKAIDLCDSLGYGLYTYQSDLGMAELTERTKIQMSIRNSVCEKWNREIIWGNPNSSTYELQRNASPYGLNPEFAANENIRGNLGVNLKIASQFYSKNGVPIQEDLSWDYDSRFDLQTASIDDQYYLQLGYTTAKLNFNREPRYYATMAFDGGVWYGNGKLDEKDQWIIQSKANQLQVKISTNRNNITGIWPKKLVHYQNIIGASNAYNVQNYAWPVMRLAELYLLYAEALNEVSGPGRESYQWINLVRERAGLPSVEESWSQYSRKPDKYTTREGFREIIQQERLNELAFEGHRFWDLRRWKKAMIEMNKPIFGWDVEQSEASLYYRPKPLYNTTFLLKDYLWPIRESNLQVNPNLVQNPGW